MSEDEEVYVPPYWSAPLFDLPCFMCKEIIQGGEEAFYYPSTGGHLCKKCAAIQDTKQLSLF